MGLLCALCDSSITPISSMATNSLFYSFTNRAVSTLLPQGGSQNGTVWDWCDQAGGRTYLKNIAAIIQHPLSGPAGDGPQNGIGREWSIFYQRDGCCLHPCFEVVEVVDLCGPTCLITSPQSQHPPLVVWPQMVLATWWVILNWIKGVTRAQSVAPLSFRRCWRSWAWSKFFHDNLASVCSFALRSRRYWISFLDLALGFLGPNSSSKGESPVESWGTSCTANNRVYPAIQSIQLGSLSRMNIRVLRL